MKESNFTVSKALMRFRKLRYFLILEGIVVGVLAGTSPCSCPGYANWAR